jgi:hypothetical protein
MRIQVFVRRLSESRVIALDDFAQNLLFEIERGMFLAESKWEAGLMVHLANGLHPVDGNEAHHTTIEIDCSDD